MSETTQALTRAAVLTFEQLAFVLPDTELNDEQMAARREARVTVVFKGSFEGKLVVSLYGGVLPSLAANMLGETAPPDEKTQQDALGELANVICGNALPAIAGSKEVFHLGAPQVELLAGTPQDQAAISAAARIALGLDKGRAEVDLHAGGFRLQASGDRLQAEESET